MALGKGKRKVSEETVRRVYGGLYYSAKPGKRRRRLEERFLQASRRMLTKLALDELGVKDRKKRQRIHRIVESVSTRSAQIEAKGGSLREDAHLQGFVEKLEAELGGPKKYGRFKRHWNRFKKQLDAIEEKISSDEKSAF